MLYGYAKITKILSKKNFFEHLKNFEPFKNFESLKNFKRLRLKIVAKK